MRGLTLRRLRTQRRRRFPGQALVETALIAPFILVLVVGGMQVAYLGYSAVTVDTAAREGARVAVEGHGSGLTGTGWSNNTYTCAADPTTDSNPICQAVGNNAGLLKGQNFSLVQIQTNVTVSRANSDVVRVGNTACSNQNDAAVAGTVSPAGIVSVTDSLGDSTTSDGLGNFTICMRGTGNTSQTVIVTATSTGCSGSTSTTISSPSNTWVASPNPISITMTCSTSSSTTTTTTTTTTSSSSSSSVTTTTSGFTNSTDVGGSTTGTGCTETPTAGTYVTVTIWYRASIFVPFINQILGDSGQSYKTMKAVVTMRVEPCTT